MKHTPGPWEIRRIVKTAIDKGKKHVCMVNFYNHPDESMRIDEKEHQANVNLIAAAPELLEAFEHVLEYSREYLQLTEVGLEYQDKADSVIAKAKGEK